MTTERKLLIALGVAAVFGLLYVWPGSPTDPAAPMPEPAPAPKVEPKPKPCPRWEACATPAVAGQTWARIETHDLDEKKGTYALRTVPATADEFREWCEAGGAGKDGWKIQTAKACVYGDPEPAVDLLAMPKELRPNNISSKGAGCCTFRSAEYAARWQNEPALYGLPELMRSKGIAGGGWPEKQAAMVEMAAREKGLPVPGFVQYSGRNPEVLIELALKTGRLPCITWGGNHMLNCVHLDATSGALVDNNDPHRVQWFSRQQFLAKVNAGGGGWVFVLTASPPPPPPKNLARQSLGCGKEACDCGCKDGDPCRCAAVVEARPCPCSPECTCGCNEGKECRCEAAPIIAGVAWTFQGKERYTVGAEQREVSRAEVEAMLDDDSGKLHLTLFGGRPEQRKAVLDSLSADQRYRVQSYDASHWALAVGFTARSAAGPTACLQRPDGVVLMRADAAADLATRLRRSDPSYQPKADPSGGGMPSLSLDAARGWAGANPLAALGAVGGVAGGAWLLLSRSKGVAGATAAPAQAQQAPQASPTDAVLLRLVNALESRQQQQQVRA